MSRQKFIVKCERHESSVSQPTKTVKGKSKVLTFPRILENPQEFLLPVSLALFRFFVVIVKCVIVHWVIWILFTIIWLW